MSEGGRGEKSGPKTTEGTAYTVYWLYPKLVVPLKGCSVLILILTPKSLDTFAKTYIIQCVIPPLVV